MQNKKFAPLFTLITLALEIGLGIVLWQHDPSLSSKGMDFEHTLEVLWPGFLLFNVLILPLIVVAMTRKGGPIFNELRTRPLGKTHVAIYSYAVGFYLSMGFCMPSLAGDPLNSGLLYGVSAALLPVFLIFLVVVPFVRYFEPMVEALSIWVFHWTGKIVIALTVMAYLLATILIMYALRQLPGVHFPYVLGAFAGAYLPLRVFLHYWGRGSMVGLGLITAGMVFQQIMLWT